jgi:membrane protease YdiL (CAAX protease family)
MKYLHNLRAWLVKYHAVGIAGDLLLVALIYLLGQTVVSLVISSAGVTKVEQLYTRPSLLVSAYLIGGAVSIVGVLCVLRIRKMSFKSINFRRPRLTDLGYGLLGFGAYFLLVRIVLLLVPLIFPSINLNQAQDIGLSNITSVLLPAAYLALAVLPPLSEELLFRGFLLTRLQGHKLSLFVSALIVSIIFGAMHGQWNVSIDTFVLSLTMIYTMNYRKSLWVTITIHALKNSLAFYALFILKIHN